MGLVCCVSREDGDYAEQHPPRKPNVVDWSTSRSMPLGPVGVDVRVSFNNASFILDNKGKITDFYAMDRRKIGEGSFGSVSKAVPKGDHTAGSEPRAVKSINKRNVHDPGKFKQEVALMKQMDHPHIIKLYESFEDARNVYLVMELCSGGELFDRITEVGNFTETQGAAIMQQITRAINYMHEKLVVHRDLKPENFLFTEKEAIEKSTIKIIDFGLSRSFTPGEVLTTYAGTAFYLAPEVLQKRYNELCDIWSMGVIAFVLLCGYPPFQGDTDAETLACVAKGKLEFDDEDWGSVSEDAKDLIRALLRMNPKDRPTARQALQHTWIQKCAPRAKPINLGTGLVKNLRRFRAQHRLKKAALHVIAGQLNDSKIKQLREIFTQLDDNGDGLLSIEELRTGIQKSELKEVPEDFQALMEEIDCDGSGVIDYTEFLAATIDRKTYTTEDVVWAAFRAFDIDGNGRISPDELKKVLSDGDVGDMLDAETIDALMAGVDTSGDGEIDFDEFMTLMQSHQR